MGVETFDNVTLSMNATAEAFHFLEESQNQMEKRFASVYDNSMQGLIAFPPQYDYGVEIKKYDKNPKKGEVARRFRSAMQYGDVNKIKHRITHLDGQAYKGA